MHDVHRDSLIQEGKKPKTKKSGPAHVHDEHEHSHDHDHPHEHEHHHGGHDHDVPSGHSHDHDEDAYEEHDHDLHAHDHGDERRHSVDRAFAHVHEHGHAFFHAHRHTHHPEHTGMVHKVFGDPRRDWFGACLMGLLIAAGYWEWLPAPLSDGMFVCAAVIGLFPIVKNALFNSLYRRKVGFDLLISMLLLAGLFTGRFLEVALITLLLLVGSFMRLNFSWKE